MISSRLPLPLFLPLPHRPFLCLCSLCSFPLPQRFAHFLFDLIEFEIDCFERRLRAESRQGSSGELDALCSSSSSPPLFVSYFVFVSSNVFVSLVSSDASACLLTIC